MMKSLLLMLFLASGTEIMREFIDYLFPIYIVGAFAPKGNLATLRGLKMGYEGELGVLPPVGFFDPLGE
jgi:hypothetical protein